MRLEYDGWRLGIRGLGGCGACGYLVALWDDWEVEIGDLILSTVRGVCDLSAAITSIRSLRRSDASSLCLMRIERLGRPLASATASGFPFDCRLSTILRFGFFFSVSDSDVVDLSDSFE